MATKKAKTTDKGGGLVVTRYNLEMVLIEPMLGTVPKNKDVYKDYIAGKVENLPGAELAEEVDTVPNMDEKAEKMERAGWTGFHTDENGIFIYDYLVKGFLKEAGNTLKDMLGVTALRSKIDNLVFVSPRQIRLKDKEDGWIERPLRAQTMQGPRVTLVRSDYVNAGTVIKCQLKVYGDVITEDMLRAILDYGEDKALGQFRNGGYGRITYTLTRVE